MVKAANRVNAPKPPCERLGCATPQISGGTKHCSLHGGGRHCKMKGCAKGACFGGTQHCRVHGGASRASTRTVVLLRSPARSTASRTAGASAVRRTAARRAPRATQITARGTAAAIAARRRAARRAPRTTQTRARRMAGASAASTTAAARRLKAAARRTAGRTEGAKALPGEGLRQACASPAATAAALPPVQESEGCGCVPSRVPAGPRFGGRRRREAGGGGALVERRRDSTDESFMYCTDEIPFSLTLFRHPLISHLPKGQTACACLLRLNLR
jgi:hypothetical protein